MATIVTEDFESGLGDWTSTGSLEVPPFDPKASVIRFHNVRPGAPQGQWIYLAKTEQHYRLIWQFIEGDVFAQMWGVPVPRIEITRSDGTVRTIFGTPADPPTCPEDQTVAIG